MKIKISNEGNKMYSKQLELMKDEVKTGLANAKENLTYIKECL